MKFKVGQIVKLKKSGLSRTYAALPGARAKVMREKYKSVYDTGDSSYTIDIKWLDQTDVGLRKSQVSGGYNVCDFEPVNLQLLFDFMKGSLAE